MTVIEDRSMSDTAKDGAGRIGVHPQSKQLDARDLGQNPLWSSAPRGSLTAANREIQMSTSRIVWQT
jgi:hypothetical protein